MDWNTWRSRKMIKKVFKMENLDCANCGAKMESGINKIEGVNKAVVSFMTQRLTIECEEEKLEEILTQAQKVCAGVDRDCRIVR